MSAESDRSLSRQDNARFLLCLTLSFAFLLGPPSWGEVTGNLIRRSVLVPFLYLQGRAEDARTSHAVRERLTSERDSAAYAAQFLPALRLENQRLRELLALGQRLAGGYVAAEVLHQALPTDGRTLLLSVGSKAGVQRFDPVVSPEGLIGVVLSAEPDHSRRDDLGPSRIPGQRLHRERHRLRRRGPDTADRRRRHAAPAPGRGLPGYHRRSGPG